MHTLSWWSVLPIFTVGVSALRVPIKDVRGQQRAYERRAVEEPKPAAAALAEVFHQHEKRLVCIYDGFLQGAEIERDTAVPWCSSYLGIKDVTATSTVTAKVYVTNIFTTIQTITDPTVTVTGSTSTVTITAGPGVKKRQNPTASAVPFSKVSAACELSPLNSTVISKASSICSCLRINPGTDYVPFTVTSTRTYTGIDYEQATVPQTVTVPGTAIVTVTVAPPTATFSQSGPPRVESGASSSTPAVSPPGTSSYDIKTVTSLQTVTGYQTVTGVVTATGVSTVTVVTTVTVTPVGPTPPYPTGTNGPRTGSEASGTGTGTLPGTGTGTAVTSKGTAFTGTGTAFTSITAVASSGGSFSGSLSNSRDTRAQSGSTSASASIFPPNSANSTGPFATSYGTSSPTSSGTAVGTSSVPYPSIANSTTSLVTVTSFRTSVGTTSYSYPGNSTSLPPRPTFGGTDTIITRQGSLLSTTPYPTSSNGSSYAPTGTGTSVSAKPTPSDTTGCPYRNGTTYKVQNDCVVQEFEIICYKNFAGPTFQGLYEQNLNDCIEDCAIVNTGFSETRCYGLVYNTSTEADKNCYFKKQEDINTFVEDNIIVAARLVGDVSYNASCSNKSSVYPTGTGSANSTYVTPTAPPFPTLSPNSREPSLFPSYTGNLTSSIFPTVSPSSGFLTSSTNSSTPFPSSLNTTAPFPTLCGAGSSVTVTETATITKFVSITGGGG